MSLVIILDGLIHQESTEKPIRGPLSYATAAEKIIRICGKGCRCREHMQPFLQKTKRRKTEKKVDRCAQRLCVWKAKNRKKHEAGQGPSQKTAKASSWLSADLMAVGLGARRI